MGVPPSLAGGSHSKFTTLADMASTVKCWGAEGTG